MSTQQIKFDQFDDFLNATIDEIVDATKAAHQTAVQCTNWADESCIIIKAWESFDSPNVAADRVIKQNDWLFTFKR